MMELCKTIKRYHADHQRENGDYLLQCFEHGSFFKLHEFVRMTER